MKLGAPQIIWIVNICIYLGIVLAKHGQFREGRHNFFTSLVATVLSFLLMYWGGFFK